MKEARKTMVYLEAQTHQRLRDLTLREGIPMAEVIRRAVAEYLGRHTSRKAVRK